MVTNKTTILDDMNPIQDLETRSLKLRNYTKEPWKGTGKKNEIISQNFMIQQ